MTKPTLKSELSQLFFYDHRNGLNPFRLDAVYEQGSHGKGNPYPHHACPSIMLPGQARNESSGRTTQEINGHINGIDTVDGRCVKGYYAGLIR